jgi:DNA mismatch repair protein MutS
MQATETHLSLFDLVERGVKLTPMMEQYFQVKKQFRDTLVLFRMGDFYELFFEDARIASRLLNISLTHRGKLDGYDIPMSGIPHHAAAAYVDKITALGLKAAICEQIEDPKLAKGIVKRAVTQIVSPGMPYDFEKITQTENRFMACACQTASAFGLVFVDFTTGEFFGLELKNIAEIIEALQIYAPKEFIAYLGQWDETALGEYLSKSEILITHLDRDLFDPKMSDIYIEKLITGYKNDEIIKQNFEITKAIGATAYYICSTQGLEELKHIRPFKLENRQQVLRVTYPTLIGLEILPKSRESYQDSLLGHFDRTKTAIGSRLLKHLFQNPVRDLKTIEARLDSIEALTHNQQKHTFIRNELEMVRDIERILAKMTTGKANASDLINMAVAIEVLLKIEHECSDIIAAELLYTFSKSEKTLLKTISQNIRTTINDEIGASLEKGNLIKTGAHKERDRLAKKSQNVAETLLEIEAKYRKETGINNLKIKSNNVAGYFIEVSKSHIGKVTKKFMRRQTLINCERYSTDELDEFEKEIISAQEKLAKLEREIFENFKNELLNNSQLILQVGKNLATLDVMQSLAWVTIQNELVRPKIFAKKKLTEIKGAFHPLIKAGLKDKFVAHNILLNDETYFGLITGPNMAGKTTVMREVAIIHFLAQVGSFVPATEAKLGLCDYLFSRLGASDDIIKGRSTFMVEMSETAEIIRHASESSLIILDEIGRGTSTFDGMSIAWSLVEYFVKNVRARTLFSTHYHELIDLVDSLEGAKNLTVKTINKNGKVQFLYELIEEGALQSFGINVAELAGLPKEVLKRSREILNHLESNDHALPIENANQGKQLNLFTPQIIETTPKHLEQIEQELKNIDVLNITPMQAMNKLYEIKQNFLS